jgi:hypothetical protein|tara:strand:+ start:2361 stop:2531 length:171 start_codon:yes stop_codon:yes gene_type:complete
MERSDLYRIDVLYVANRIKTMEQTKNEKQLRKLITEFKEELVYNIGVDKLIEYNGL